MVEETSKVYFNGDLLRDSMKKKKNFRVHFLLAYLLTNRSSKFCESIAWRSCNQSQSGANFQKVSSICAKWCHFVKM